MVVVAEKKVRKKRSGHERISHALVRAHRKQWTPEAFEAFQRHVRARRPAMLHGSMLVAFASAKNPEDLRNRIWGALCRANKPFIMVLVRKAIRDRGLNDDVSLDLFQEGCIGMGIALERYDSARSDTFSNCARNWVQASVTRAAERAYYRTVLRVPAHQIEWLRKVNGVDRWLSARHGRPPTTEELIDQILAERWKKGKSFVTRGELYGWMAILGYAGHSLQAPNHQGSTAEYRIPDRGARNPESLAVIRAVRREIVENIREIEKLILRVEGERNWLIFRLRTGVCGDETMTLNAVAADERVGVTRERVRQVELSCFRQIDRRLRLPRDEVLGYASMLNEIDKLLPLR